MLDGTPAVYGGNGRSEGGAHPRLTLGLPRPRLHPSHIHSSTHPLIHPLTYDLTHSPAHLLTQLRRGGRPTGPPGQVTAELDVPARRPRQERRLLPGHDRPADQDAADWRVV